MPQVFLSYSRKDQPFVRKLHASLEAVGRETWVDWSDIPPTAEFHQEIYGGIESADTFMFIISPDSAVSRVCAEEVAYAIQYQKRLIPVLYREAPADSIHPALAAHNWIYCRENDDFETAFQQLTAAIDTDLAQARMHTRLLVRARDWEAHDRASSLLLRGNDLHEAEEWLMESSGKQPVPLALHMTYVGTSRHSARTRYRILLYSSVTGLVISLLMIFALLLSARQAVGLGLALRTQYVIETQLNATVRFTIKQSEEGQLTQTPQPTSTAVQ